MTINAQLSQFYNRQGLTGKHRRSALKHDRRKVRRNTAQYQSAVAPEERWTPTSLGTAFSWFETSEGCSYWSARNLYVGPRTYGPVALF